MPIGIRGTVATLIWIVLLAGCRESLVRQYEYEEEVYLDLDGSATVFVNASVAALVALRGLDLDVAPRSRFDRRAVRAAFEDPSVEVIRVSTSRKRGRRFAHVRLETRDIRQLSGAAPLSWSRYAFDRREQRFVFAQIVGAPEGRPIRNVGWRGDELVAFRIHLPSRIHYHNTLPGNLRRGNILVWEQTLADRQAGRPLHMEAHIDSESILRHTLWVFAATGAVVAAMFVGVIWWVTRRAREINPTQA